MEQMDFRMSFRSIAVGKRRKKHILFRTHRHVSCSLSVQIDADVHGSDQANHSRQIRSTGTGLSMSRRDGSGSMVECPSAARPSAEYPPTIYPVMPAGRQTVTC